MSIIDRHYYFLSNITKVCGLSGYTCDIGKFVLGEAKKLNIITGVDVFGSVSALISVPPMVSNGRRIMISAHMDSCGYLISDIGKTTGRLLLKRTGTPSFEGRFSGKLFSKDKVISIKIEDEGVDDDIEYLDELYECTATGHVSPDDLHHICIGDVVQYDSPISKSLHGKYTGAFLDNKAGVAALMCVMENLSKNNKLSDNFYCVFTELEEISDSASFSAAAKIKPHIHVCIDICPHKKRKDVGNKVVIYTGPLYNKVLVNLAIKTAQDSKIPYEIKVMPEDTLSEVVGVIKAAGGVACVEFGIPGFNLHTPNELVSKKGLTNTIKLVYNYCLNLGGIKSLSPIQEV